MPRLLELPGARLLPTNHYVVRNVAGGLETLWSQRMTRYPAYFLLLLFFLGVAGPWLAPYDIGERQYADGDLLRGEGPSVDHPLGTTSGGKDVLSRVLVGAGPTAVTGVLGGAMIASIGLTIGVTAGYVGGVVDDVLMRITDVAYSVPLIPFAIVIIASFGIGFFTSIFVIGILLWRSSARVLRSQVLQIKERSYVQAAKATGASTPRIIVRHILPNVASMAVLYFALGMGFAIQTQAGLSFVGVTEPFNPSWGNMIRNAYESGYMTEQLLWPIVPGLLISLTVLSTFLLGRGFESFDDDPMTQA